MTAGSDSILVVVASNRRRGAEVFGERLTAGLDALGWSAGFVALQSVGATRTVSATPLRSGEASSRFDLRTVAALRKRIAADLPSVVLANGGPTLRYAVAAVAAVRRRPLLAYGSIGEPRYWLRSGSHVRLQRFLHRRADVILAVSEMTRSQLISDLGVAAGKVFVAPTGVPPGYFLDRHRSESSARDEPGDPLRLLFLGSLSTEKDPHRAIDVVQGVGREHPVRLRLVGDGPLMSDLARRVEGTGLGDTVELVGSVADVTPHLEWADALILTSRTEGLPGAVLEAAAAGVPAIAFGVGGTAETMQVGRSGVLVTPGDVAAMVTAVTELAADRATLVQMGAAAREYVGEHYTLEKSIKRFDDILRQAAAARRSR